MLNRKQLPKIKINTHFAKRDIYLFVYVLVGNILEKNIYVPTLMNVHVILNVKRHKI